MTGDGTAGPISVEGRPVEGVVNAPTMPEVTHGRFGFTNNTDRILKASLVTVEVVTANGRESVDEFHLYVLPDYDELDPGDVQIPPSGRVEVEVSFAGHPASPAGDPGVVVEVAAGGRIVRERSPVTLIVRTRSR